MNDKELNFVPISIYFILFFIGTVGNLMIVCIMALKKVRKPTAKMFMLMRFVRSEKSDT